MEIISCVCLNIITLYILVILGYIGGKCLNVHRESIAQILFYIVVPIVFFEVGLKTEIDYDFLLIPIILFLVSATLCFSYLYISNRIWHDCRANLIAFASGTGNTGYFGFPLALMLFNEQAVGIYMLGNIGFSIYDYSVGAYIISRGNYTKKEAINKVSKLPMIYAFLIGLLLNGFGWSVPAELIKIAEYMRGTYITLGMMIIGLGLATVKSFRINIKFLSLFLSAKFIAAPLLILLLIQIDKTFLHLFLDNEFVYETMVLLAIVPPAANTVVFATLNKCYPEEAAAAVLVGTLLALVYVPFMIFLLMR